MKIITFSQIDDDTLKILVASSNSLKEVLRQVNMSSSGTAHKYLKKRITNLGIDYSHWKRINKTILTNDQKFISNSSVGQHVIKRAVIKDKLLDLKCAICNLESWLGNPIVLHLDHINGINNDHRLENLRFLCPNCHSQTDTYCRGSKPKFNRSKCKYCKTTIQENKVMCSDCRQSRLQIRNLNLRKSNLGKGQKIIWPSVDALKAKLETISCLALARELGVSDNSIRKHLKQYS